MLLDARLTRLLLQAAESVGIPCARVLEPLGLDERSVAGPQARVEWSTLARMCDQIAEVLEHDEDTLRLVGARMMQAPAYAPLRQLARSVVSVRALYEIVNRWVVPPSFPHLRLTAQHVGRSGLALHGEIPPSYAPSRAFLLITLGSMGNLPTLLDLPPATILESHTTPRSLDVLLDLPRASARSMLGSVRRATRALFAPRSADSVLEGHRRDLMDQVEALQRAREELRMLLERLPDLVIVHRRGTLLWANRAWLDAVGYEKVEDVVGTSILDNVSRRSRDVVRDRMALPPDTPNLSPTEIVMVTRSGAEVVVEVSPAQAVVFDGLPARLVVSRDVTERVRMKQKLIVADRLSSMGLLAAGVAHEVNNPLAYVLNNIEIARRELAVLGPEADVSRNVLSVALEGVDRIRTIVRDLLMLSRGEEGSIRSVDPQTATESTLVLASREIERTARLVTEFHPAPMVQASDARIAQIVLNLVANALEAMRDRPREESVLTVRVGRASDGRGLLEVQDTGRGIADANLPRLFEPFFTTKPAGDGTGLGLTIVQRLVSEMGGEIVVTSQLGVGTTFRILLPAVASVAPHARVTEELAF